MSNDKNCYFWSANLRKIAETKNQNNMILSPFVQQYSEILKDNGHRSIMCSSVMFLLQRCQKGQ